LIINASALYDICLFVCMLKYFLFHIFLKSVSRFWNVSFLWEASTLSRVKKIYGTNIITNVGKCLPTRTAWHPKDLHLQDCPFCNIQLRLTVTTNNIHSSCCHKWYSLLVNAQKHFLHSYLLTPYSTVLLEKLTGFQLVKKFPAFYGN
jgi:hypothetical protein